MTSYKNIIKFFMANFIITHLLASQPKTWQLGFQTPASPHMEAIAQMHDLLLKVIFAIAVVVTLLLAYTIFRFRESKNKTPTLTTHHTLLEIVWTLIPVIILICIGIPSIRMLYHFDKPIKPELTIKAIGHQWYWSYEYPLKDGKQISFDSMMIEDKDLQPGQLRLLDVDNPIIVPQDATVQMLVTSSDVLHSFAVPALGVKRDAVPGRINETWFKIAQPGMYYGQCSELCGSKHGFMPIAIKVVSKEAYNEWLQMKSGG